MTDALAQTVLQIGITNYQPSEPTHFSVTHFIPSIVTHVSYANSVTRFIRRPLPSIRGAVLGRCGN